ncbi:MAG: pitrilysin family protein [Rikenellaceae bacterium]
MQDNTTTLTTQLPEVVIPTRLDLIEEIQHTCANGINLHSLKCDSSAEVVRLSLVFKGGSSVQDKFFAAASTLSMLSEGTEDYNAAEIAEKLDFYGIFYDNSTDRDYCYITLAALRKFLPQALTLLESMILRPLFLDSEFKLYKGKKKQQLTIDRSKPSFMAREAFTSLLFGEEHPYGRFADAELYDELSSVDLKKHYKEYLHADNCFAVASGDLGSEDLELIKSLLEKIPQQTTPSQHIDYTIHENTTHTLYIERSEAVQSCIRMGKTIVAKSHPDFIPLQLLCTVLGGYFGSRLVTNLRERNGYTYGAYCGIVTLAEASYMAIATDVDSSHTIAATQEIRNEIERLRTEEIPQEELDEAISSITGELMRIIDGPFGIADIAIENIQSGMPADYLNHFLASVTKVTPSALQEVAGRYFGTDSFKNATVGAPIESEPTETDSEEVE